MVATLGGIVAGSGGTTHPHSSCNSVNIVGVGIGVPVLRPVSTPLPSAPVAVYYVAGSAIAEAVVVTTSMFVTMQLSHFLYPDKSGFPVVPVYLYQVIH